MSMLRGYVRQVTASFFFFILRYVHVFCVFRGVRVLRGVGKTDPCWPMRVGNHVENLLMTFSIPST